MDAPINGLPSIPYNCYDTFGTYELSQLIPNKSILTLPLHYLGDQCVLFVNLKHFEFH